MRKSKITSAQVPKQKSRKKTKDHSQSFSISPGTSRRSQHLTVVWNLEREGTARRRVSDSLQLSTERHGETDRVIVRAFNIMERITFWTPLVVLAVFLCHLQTSTACSCVYRHPQTKFCESDFVALVTVEEFSAASESEYTVSYKVHINETFKVTPSAQTELEKTPVTLWTRSNSGLCGLVGLRPGDSWVLGGSINGGRLHISSCGLAMLWSNVTPHQRDNFRQFYQEACACQILYKYGEAEVNKSCSVWEAPTKESDCQDRFDICMPGTTGCSWTPCKTTA